MKLNLPDDYVVAEGEANNLVYLTLKYTVGWNMRACDFQVMFIMQEQPITGQAGIEKLVKDTCEFAWDHIAGEPDEFTAEQLYEHMETILQEWYDNTTREQRENTSSEEN